MHAATAAAGGNGDDDDDDNDGSDESAPSRCSGHGCAAFGWPEE